MAAKIRAVERTSSVSEFDMRADRYETESTWAASSSVARECAMLFEDLGLTSLGRVLACRLTCSFASRLER
jgi:hypothetical protein